MYDSLDHEEAYMRMVRMLEQWLNHVLADGRPVPRRVPKTLLFRMTIENMEEAGITPRWWTSQTKKECEIHSASMDYKFVPYKRMEISIHSLRLVDHVLERHTSFYEIELYTINYRDQKLDVRENYTCYLWGAYTYPRTMFQDLDGN
jgi:hypothetical protein